MQEKLDYALFNSINVGAISFTFIQIESVLTIAVLIYNIKKLRNKND